jgi:TrmH family RNA methyltransferase
VTKDRFVLGLSSFVNPITSLQNPKVKYAVALRERRNRIRAGVILVEGCEELTLALDSGAAPVDLFICPPLFREAAQSALADRAARAGADVANVDERAFRKMAYRQRPDGWLATVRFSPRRLDDLQLGRRGAAPFVVVGESLEKPGNLGAILRTADAAGVDAVVSCEPHTDWGNPNVVRASKGAVFAVPVVDATSADTIAWLRQQGIKIVVASPQAATVYTSADLAGPVAIAVGTEKQGLSQAWFDAADEAVVIPMHGRVNSLNVSTATALLLYEIVRQRSR